MRFLRSLRGRLVLGAAVAVLLAVAGVGIAASAYVTRELTGALDTSLKQRAGDTARLSASAPALLTTPGVLDSASGGRQLNVEVLDRRQRIVSRSLSLGARTLPMEGAVTRALQHGVSGYADFTAAGRPGRLFAAPLADTGGEAAGGVVIVAAETGDIDTLGRHLRAGLLGFGALAALLGAAAAALLVTRALRPLRRLSSGVRAIEHAGHPAARLPEPATEDEVHDLAAALNRMLSALEATSRRERRMLADASHELRTPLTSLVGNIDYLASHGATVELVTDLQHDATRLRRLVEDLLTLEREGATAPPAATVDLAAIIASETDGRERVEVDLPTSLDVPGDAEALRRAIINLVENALVHGPPRGRVRVTLRTENEEAVLSIRDEGAGIPFAAREVAFERFWRGAHATQRPGSGLGLAIVRATAERHGGTVRSDGPVVTLVVPRVTVGGPREARTA